MSSPPDSFVGSLVGPDEMIVSVAVPIVRRQLQGEGMTPATAISAVGA